MTKAALISLFVTSLLSASPLVQVQSTLSVDACTQKIEDVISSKKGFGVMAVIDHQKNAQKVGMRLPAQRVIVFGNPKAGTVLMQDDAQIGYDLPLRIMVREAEGVTLVEYRDPQNYTKMYELNGSLLPTKMAKLLNTLAKSCQ